MIFWIDMKTMIIFSV